MGYTKGKTKKPKVCGKAAGTTALRTSLPMMTTPIGGSLAETHLLSSTSFSEACREQSSGENHPKTNGESGLEQRQDNDMNTKPAAAAVAVATLSLDAAVSLASMRQDHRNDPPLPTDVLQRIFEPVSTSTATTTHPSAAAASSGSSSASVLALAGHNQQTASPPSIATSDLEFSTALDMLNISKPSPKPKLEPVLSTDEDLPVPISPSHSQQSEFISKPTDGKQLLLAPLNIKSDRVLPSVSNKTKKTASKRKLPTNNAPKENIKRPRFPASSLKEASASSSSSTTTTYQSIIPQSIPAYDKDRKPIILRCGTDPKDGSPTVVRIDGDVLREYKPHRLPGRQLNSSGNPLSLHDELLEVGFLIPSKEDLDSCSTTRQQNAFWTFTQRINELRQYTQHHGDANVPQQLSEAHSLGIWVNKMRMEKKKMDVGEKTSLTERKVELLEFFGFVWAQSCKGELGWENRFCELKKFKEMHGHCNVPTKCKKNRALGRWVSTQRALYKSYHDGRGSRTVLREEMKRRIRVLEELGFCFSMLMPGEMASEEGEGKVEMNAVTGWTDVVPASAQDKKSKVTGTTDSQPIAVEAFKRGRAILQYESTTGDKEHKQKDRVGIATKDIFGGKIRAIKADRKTPNEIKQSSSLRQAERF